MVLDLMHTQNLHYQMVNGVKNVLTFGVGNILSLHPDNRKKDVLVLGEGLTNGSDDTKKGSE